MNIVSLLKQAIDKKLINLLDFLFALTIAKNQSPKIILLSVCMHYFISIGNTCLPILCLKNKTVFDEKDNKKFIAKIWKITNLSKHLKSELLTNKIISNGSHPTPFIILNQKIYFYKTWLAERKIFKFISQPNKFKKNLIYIKKNIATLLHENTEDLQKIAIILSIINRITFIMGGPGTGKTTIASKILIATALTFRKKIKIQLTAPTGKASHHLTNSIKKSMLKLSHLYKKKHICIKPAITLHRLLNINTAKNKHFVNTKLPLDIDLLIIDESSMIDIFIMEELIKNISKHTKIIFLGDHNQLPSIKCGHILKDVYSYYKSGYSKKTIELINQFDIFNLKEIKHYKFSNINDKICILKKNYRCDIKSNISKISIQIKKNTFNNFKKLFLNNYHDINFFSLKTIKDYKIMISNLTKNYINYWKNLKEIQTPLNAISYFNNFRLMCVLKSGPFGVKGINAALEYEMKKLGLININIIDGKSIYFGQPILILKNSYTIKLFNGDIGVIMYDKNKNLKAFFYNYKKLIRSIPINLLPEFQTNWITTVHKSQGSEFNHSTLILPNSYSSILTKELIYTAITRSQDKLTIYSDKNIFIKSIKNETRRHSGLSIDDCSY
ncbi:MAG: exodeoxyribonuclease V subunit alpha [Buchnera aphidicola (Schlechtendalia peitan)]